MPDFSEAVPERFPDGGPVYVETPAHPEIFDSWAAEPWNTATAALFIVIPLAWLWHLRGRWSKFPFLVGCLPILLTGGIGGTLFHGLRKYRAFFLMDVIPIYFLGMLAAIYLWVRLGPRIAHLLGMIAALVLIQFVARAQLSIHWAINVSYANLAFIILLPIIPALCRTRFRHAGWIYTSLVCFTIAWVCRLVDRERPPLLPMGTHWLWHVFGAATTLTLIAYIYRIEGLSLRKARPTATRLE